MPSYEPAVAQLKIALAQALTTRMERAGWSVDPARDVASGIYSVAVFRHPAADDFTATVEFHRTGPTSDSGPLLSVGATVAVDYEPAYRLAPLLLNEPSHGECDIEAGELVDPPSRLTVSVSDAGEVDSAAERLVAPLQEAAVSYARSHATLDDLLDCARSDPELFHVEITTVPLLLAAAGRHDEARAALSEYQASGEEEVEERDYRRFARRLTRWLDAGGILPDPPTSPVNPRPVVRESDLPSFSAHRDQSKQRREAFKTVKQQAAGRSDDELRDMLQTELDQRGLTEDPLWFESAIDAMRRTPLEEVQATIQGVSLLVGAGARLVNVFRGKRLDPIERVEWLEPPDRASYPIKGDGWVAVELGSDINAFLARAHAAGHRVAHVSVLDAWIDWDPQPGSPESRLIVLIGSQQVGAVNAADTERFAAAMVAAAEHDEVPTMRARLAELHHAPGYLLEIAAP
jgi:hypothetical protein